MLNIVLSFDYELYLGENFLSAEEILFNPSKRLIDLLSEEGVSGTFFADICSYIAHEKNGLSSYCDSFERQLKYMQEKGQDVQLHIHPHWYKCSYNGKAFEEDVDYYSLQDFAKNEGLEKIKEIVADASNRLNGMLGEGNECVAFRAGGLVMRPYEKEIVRALLENGILIDSTIAPGMDIKEAYVYTNVPQSFNNWNISPEKGLFEDDSKNTGLLEVPVGTIRNNPFRFLSVLPKKLRMTPGPAKGTYFGAKKKKAEEIRATKVQTLKRRLCGTSILSMDTKTADLLLTEIKAVYKAHHCDKSDYAIALIAHPKTMTNETFDNIKKLVRGIKSTKGVRIVSMKNIAVERGLK